MIDSKYRIEKDSMGELKVPKESLWGAQTQRAIENFPISGITVPDRFIAALGLVKWAAAGANAQLDLIEEDIAASIQMSATSVAEGHYNQHFPIDIFQTGSGTSSNMNANEVISRLASNHLGFQVHPNDHVNMSQSSNDVIPTCIHVSSAISIQEKLLPSISHLCEILKKKSIENKDLIKTGRTHLMDAMPITFKQELDGWHAQINSSSMRLKDSMKRLLNLAQGGTAVGTGINAPQDFGNMFSALLEQKTGMPFKSAGSKFESISTMDTAVEVSGQLKVLAVSLIKISNDLRWMNSGPLAGIGEIELPPLQPGSSIMPGKVNPVIPEAVAMACTQVIGNDTAITLAGQSGNFQLNVMLPIIAHNLLQSIELLSNSIMCLADKAIAGFSVNKKGIQEALYRNPILATALNPVIGYEKSANIAKTAYTEGRPIKEVAREMTDLTDEDLDRLLNLEELTKGGIK
jgi:fumarate hydratase class II